MKTYFSIILKVLGYIFTLCLIIGGGHMFMNNLDYYTSDFKHFGIFLVAGLVYLGAALLCFWGSRKLKNNKSNKNNDNNKTETEI